MQITRVTVSAQRKVPHPSIDYANLSALVSLEAVLSPDDSPTKAITHLQESAEGLVEQHLDKLVMSLSARHREDVVSAKARAATEEKAAALAAKHGGVQ